MTTCSRIAPVIFFALFLANLYDKQKQLLGEYFRGRLVENRARQHRAGTSGGMGLAAERV